MIHRAIVFYAEDRPGAGRIVSVFTGDEASVQAHTDRAAAPWLELSTDFWIDPLSLLRGQYVDLTGPQPLLAPCLPMPAEWKPEAATFTGLPQPCTVRVLGVAHQVDDGVADLTDLPAADYAVTVSAAGYLTQTYQVTL